MGPQGRGGGGVGGGESEDRFRKTYVQRYDKEQ